MKEEGKLKLPPKEIIIWHKDGIVGNTNLAHKEARVYVNGKLKDTDGQWEHLVITTASTPTTNE